MDDDDDEDEFEAVIRWYQFFIAAKLIRALMSSVDEDDYLDVELGAIQMDRQKLL